MNKFVLLSLFCVVSMYVLAAHNTNVLPGDAVWFIEKGFPQQVIISIDGGDTYDVELDNGVVIEFDKKGMWKDVKCDKCKTGLPLSALPSSAFQIIFRKFPTMRIIKMERTNSGTFELHLANGVVLEFDRNWQLTEIDD